MSSLILGIPQWYSDPRGIEGWDSGQIQSIYSRKFCTKHARDYLGKKDNRKAGSHQTLFPKNRRPLRLLSVLGLFLSLLNAAASLDLSLIFLRIPDDGAFASLIPAARSLARLIAQVYFISGRQLFESTETCAGMWGRGVPTRRS